MRIDIYPTKQGVKIKTGDTWTESKHPRANNGEFSSGGGGSKEGHSYNGQRPSNMPGKNASPEELRAYHKSQRKEVAVGKRTDRLSAIEASRKSAVAATGGATNSGDVSKPGAKGGGEAIEHKGRTYYKNGDAKLANGEHAHKYTPYEKDGENLSDDDLDGMTVFQSSHTGLVHGRMKSDGVHKPDKEHAKDPVAAAAQKRHEAYVARMKKHK